MQIESHIGMPLDDTHQQHETYRYGSGAAESAAPSARLVALDDKRPRIAALRDVNTPYEDFSGDGAAVSYLAKKGDNHETYDDGTCNCVHSHEHVRAGASSRTFRI